MVETGLSSALSKFNDGRQMMAKKIESDTYKLAMDRALADPAAAKFWVGLDVGLRSTSVCVVDADGAVVHQAGMKSSPVEIGRYLRKNFLSHVTLIGLESGGLAAHLATHLRKDGFRVVVLDALQVHRVLSIRRNKTDTNDARGIAEITRTGREYLSEVFVKSTLCYEIRAHLILRNRLVRQRLANEETIRGLLRLYGGRIEPGAKCAQTFRERAIDQMCIIADQEGIDLRPRMVPILDLCERLYDQASRMEGELELLAAANPVCKRMMTIPGVGAITALSFFSAIEDPSRFARLDDVAAYLGLTPRVYQSGDSLTHGSISKMGNQMTRTHLVSAATVMLSATKSHSTLKDWGMKLSKRVGFNKAKVALARKLAIIMLSIWRDSTHFQFKGSDVDGHREVMRARPAKA
jgi:transposase